MGAFNEMTELFNTVLADEPIANCRIENIIKEKQEYIHQNREIYHKTAKGLAAIKILKDKECKASADVDELNATMKKIDDELRAKRKDREEITHEIAALKSRIKQLESEQEAAQSQVTTVEQNNNGRLNKLKWDFQLYQLISKIKWKLESDASEFSGIIFKNDAKPSMNPFLLNKEHNSSFFISNYLWDMMENEF